jgi:putative FmdB family regulatory protein
VPEPLIWLYPPPGRRRPNSPTDRHPEDLVPTYQYACTECDHRFEAVQAFTDDSLTVCPVCGGSLRKVYGSVGVVFKGSGFYRTDSRASSTSTAPAAGSGEKSGAGEKSGSDKGADKGGDKKAAATSGSSDSSGGAKASSTSGSSSGSSGGSAGSGSSSGSSGGSKAAAG